MSLRSVKFSAADPVPQSSSCCYNLASSSCGILLGPPVLPLLSFPRELILLVAANLPVKDLANLAIACGYLYGLLNPQLYSVGAVLYSPVTLDTPLHWAARNNQLETAQRLLQRGDPIITNLKEYATDDDGPTPFHTAVKHEHLELVVSGCPVEGCIECHRGIKDSAD